MLSAISIHSLRMEGDGNSQTFGEWLEDFNPLPPHGGRQLEYARPAVEENFNPLPPHGGRPIGKAVGDDVPDISIHSLRMEGDATLKHNWGISRYFNPLPPHGGRLVAGYRRTHVARHFNPLPPHGGRLFLFLFSVFMTENFNPLPPHGGRQLTFDLEYIITYFNPLPPHGGRPFSSSDRVTRSLFQSTPSAWRETSTWVMVLSRFTVFQSTPSAWRETALTLHVQRGVAISIHSLRMEGDKESKKTSQ